MKRGQEVVLSVATLVLGKKRSLSVRYSPPTYEKGEVA